MKVLKRVKGEVGKYETILESDVIHIELSENTKIRISVDCEGYFEIVKSSYNYSDTIEIKPMYSNAIRIK